MSEPVVIFDLDGVLVDSVESLYEAYASFLAGFGRTGSREEFDRLNGPALSAIVAELRVRHDLEPDVERLIERYRNGIEQAHRAAPLMPGVEELLCMLRAAGVRLALASSAEHATILTLLDRHSLRDLFDIVVSGDRVAAAKPHPEIYRVAARHFENATPIVVEDSAHGVTAAKEARLAVVQLCRDGAPDPRADWIATTTSELSDVLFAQTLSCRWTAGWCRARLEPVDPPDVKPQVREEIDRAWARARAERPHLFDGRALAHLGHQFDGIDLQVRCAVMPYRYVIGGRLQDGATDPGFRPLAVSGVLVDAAGRTLFATRRNVTEYEGHLELVPSGGLEAPSAESVVVDPIAGLLDELKEETSLTPADVEHVRPLGLVEDCAHGVIDLCYALHVRPEVKLDEVVCRSEYENPRVVELARVFPALSGCRLVPTSRLALALLDRTRRVARDTAPD